MSNELRTREMRITIEEPATGERGADAPEVFSVAISSELPVLRKFRGDAFYEVLEHSDQAVVMDRLRDGAALLFNHNSDQHLGIVENPRIGSDGVLRGDMRFAENQLAQEKKKDVINGTLPWVSVQYNIMDTKTEKKNRSGLDTVRVTKWEPMEVSLVTIPADRTVGVGRSEEPFDPEAFTAQLQELEAKVAEAEQRAAELQSKVSGLEKDNEALRLSNEAAMKELDQVRSAIVIESGVHDDAMRRAKAELEQSHAALTEASLVLQVIARRDEMIAEVFGAINSASANASGLVEHKMNGLSNVIAQVESASRGVKAIVTDYSNRLLLRSLKNKN